MKISFIAEFKLEPLLRAFCGGKFWKLQTLKGGLLNQNYILLVGPKKYMLKVYRPEVTEQRATEMFQVMDFVASLGLPVVCPLEVMVIDGNIVAIFPFVNGDHPPRYKKSPAQIRSMGAMLGQVHTALDVYKPITKIPIQSELIKSFEPRNSLEQVSILRDQLRDQSSSIRRTLAGVLDTYEATIYSQTWDVVNFSKLPIRFIHGDYHMFNLLMQGTKVVTVLDWEKTGWNFRGYEIMRSIIHNCNKQAGTLDWLLVEQYLQGYREHATLSSIEAELTFECGYRRVAFSFWTIQQYLAGHKNFLQSIMRREKTVQLLTKNRAEFAERIGQLLK